MRLRSRGSSAFDASGRGVLRSPQWGRFAAMRIAFSGSHRVGKTTLVERVAERLPQYETVDEPYYLLEEDGYEAAEVPTIEDFEAQLVRSFAALGEPGRDVLFDRCPVDVLAYLLEHEDAR